MTDATGTSAAVPDRMTIHFIRDITGLPLATIRATLDQHGIPYDNDIVNRKDIPRNLFRKRLATNRVTKIRVSREMAEDTALLESMAARPDVELVWPVGEWVWDYEEELMRRATEGPRDD